MGPDNEERLENFNRYFELALAFSPKQRAQVYRVRYRVYCEEFGFEPEAIFGACQEVDEFDRQSVHCLVLHKRTGVPAGCVRVVLVEQGERLPMELHAADSLDKRFMHGFDDKRQTVCEVSRLAVDGAFRRRRREWTTRFGTIDELEFSEDDRRTFPLIALSLFLAAAAVADLMNRKNCFAIMEPFLPKMLRHTGVRFHRIGEEFEFRGRRAPYYANIDALIREAPPALRHWYEGVRKKFGHQLPPLYNPMAVAVGVGGTPIAGGFRSPARAVSDFLPRTGSDR